MITTEDYQVKYPIELFIDWMKRRAIEDGVISLNSEIIISSISYDLTQDYVTIDGTFNKRMDS